MPEQVKGTGAGAANKAANKAAHKKESGKEGGGAGLEFVPPAQPTLAFERSIAVTHGPPRPLGYLKCGCRVASEFVPRHGRCVTDQEFWADSF